MFGKFTPILRDKLKFATRHVTQIISAHCGFDRMQDPFLIQLIFFFILFFQAFFQQFFTRLSFAKSRAANPTHVRDLRSHRVRRFYFLLEINECQVTFLQPH